MSIKDIVNSNYVFLDYLCGIRQCYLSKTCSLD